MSFSSEVWEEVPVYSLSPSITGKNSEYRISASWQSPTPPMDFEATFNRMSLFDSPLFCEAIFYNENKQNSFLRVKGVTKAYKRDINKNECSVKLVYSSALKGSKEKELIFVVQSPS